MNKIFLSLGLVVVLTYNVPTMHVQALSNTSTQTISTENQARAA